MKKNIESTVIKYYSIAFERSTFENAYELGFKHMQYFLKSTFEILCLFILPTHCAIKFMKLRFQIQLFHDEASKYCNQSASLLFSFLTNDIFVINPS